MEWLTLSLIFNLGSIRVWFLKLHHSEAKEQVVYNVNIRGGSSSVLELLETIGNSGGEIPKIRLALFLDSPIIYNVGALEEFLLVVIKIFL